MKLTKERKNELKALAIQLIEKHHIDSWGYTEHWDGLIECDEVMTIEEWEWLSENFTIETVTKASLKAIKK